MLHTRGIHWWWTGGGGGGEGTSLGGGGGGGGVSPGGMPPAESVKSITGANTSMSSCDVRSVKSRLLTFSGKCRMSVGGIAQPSDLSISLLTAVSAGGGVSASGSLGT